MKQNEYEAGISDQEFKKLLSDISSNIFTNSFLRIGFWNEDADGPRLTDIHVIKLAKAIAQNRHITKLDLSNNKIKDEGAAALSKLSTVNEMWLQSNQITIKGAEALSKNKLTHLNLSSNPIYPTYRGSIYDYSRHEHLVENLYNNMIRYLDISFSEIPNMIIAQLIKKNCTIKHLRIGGNITDEVLKYIGNNTNLKKLHIDGSIITNLGVEHLLKNIGLVTLHIRKSEIDSQGAKMLSTHQSLQKLTLIDSNISYKGAESFYNGTIENIILFNSMKHLCMSPDEIQSFTTNFKLNQDHIRLKKQQDYYHQLTNNTSSPEINPDMNNFNSIQDAIDILQKRWAESNLANDKLLRESEGLITKVKTHRKIKNDQLLLAQENLLKEFQNEYGKQQLKKLLNLSSDLNNESFRHDLEQAIEGAEPLKALAELLGLHSNNVYN